MSLYFKTIFSQLKTFDLQTQPKIKIDMKNLCLSIVLTFIFSLNCYALSSTDSTSSKKVLHPSLELGFFAGVSGTLTMENDSIFFLPKEYDEHNIFQRFCTFDQYNHLITPIHIPLSKVAKIVRRNPLLVFPNKFVIKMQDGKKYRFFTYRRGRVIKYFKEFQARNN